MIAQEEQEIIHHFIVLTMARKAIEIDLNAIEKSPLKLKEVYLYVLRNLLNELSKELSLIKRFMQQRQLKVTIVANDGMFTHYHYYCRGSYAARHYLNAHLKNVVHSYIQSHIQMNHDKSHFSYKSS